MGLYVVETSALYPLIVRLREKLLQHLNNLAILDLTVYEVGSTVWREYRRNKIIDPNYFINCFQRF